MSNGKQLTVIERASVALGSSEHEKKLKALAERSRDITGITNQDGYRQCHSARMVLKNERINLERLGKAAREDAQSFAKAVIREQDRLIGIIANEEARLQTLQGEWDAIEERKREAEAYRVSKLQAAVEAINAVPAEVVGKPSEFIAERLLFVQSIPVQDYQEFEQFAREAVEKAVAAMTKLHEVAVVREREDAEEKAKIEAERAELAKLRAAEEERQRTEAARIAQEAAERDKAEAEAKDRIAAEERASKARIEAQEAESRKIIAEAERIAKVTREAEEAKARVERDAAEAEESALRELEQKAERERKQAERDAIETDELLCAILMRIDDKPQYAAIGEAIMAYFEDGQQRKAA